VEKLFVYSDGGARGNPGKAAIGIVILDENRRELKTYKKYLGIKTNNQAEYLALITALEIAKKYAEKINCYSDSELIISQITGKYKIKNKELKRLFDLLKSKEKEFKEIFYQNVPRKNKFIQEADRLVNEVLDKNA